MLMKIAQIVIGFHPEIGGYGRHVSLIGSELQRRGHKVSVVTTNFSPSDSKVKTPFKVTRLWNDPLLKFTPGLLSYLSKHDFDVVHVHAYPSFQPYLVSFSKLFKKERVVFTPHYHPFGGHPKWQRYLFDLVFGRFAFRQADRIIALTSYERKLLIKQGVPGSKIRIIPNPIDLRKSKGNASLFRKKYNVSNFVLFVGRLEEQKGLEYLIKAASNARRPLVVIGKDAGFLERAREIAKGTNTLFLGDVSRSDLLNAFAACKLLVLPSKYEAFGIVFIEAMSFGKPVIGSKVGPVPSIINNAGLTVEYGDVLGLSKAINNLYSNNTLYKRMSKQAKSESKKYDVKSVVDKLISVYKELL